MCTVLVYFAHVFSTRTRLAGEGAKCTKTYIVHNCVYTYIHTHTYIRTYMHKTCIHAFARSIHYFGYAGFGL